MVKGPTDHEDEKTHIRCFLTLSLQEFRTLELSGRLAASMAKVRDFRLLQDWLLFGAISPPPNPRASSVDRGCVLVKQICS